MKHIEIKDIYKYVILDMLLNFGSLDNMRITSSEPKYNLGISGERFITSLGIKAKEIPKKYKKSRHAIGNVRNIDLSKIIR